MRRRWLPLMVLVVALAGLVGSMLWVVTDGRFAAGGDDPVRDLAEARAAADRLADRWAARSRVPAS